MKMRNKGERVKTDIGFVKAVDLYTALKLTGSSMPDDVIFLRGPSDEPPYRAAKIMSLREVREKYDMRRTMVIRITPYFQCMDYAGMLLTVIERK